jgi:N6-adenosine-specific RNA methylase IME4
MGWERKTVNHFAGIDGQSYGCILADPPWRFRNRTGKVAPEHRRLNRYASLSLEEIRFLPVGGLSAVSNPLPEDWGPANPKLLTTHSCKDGHQGIADIIGGTIDP